MFDRNKNGYLSEGDHLLWVDSLKQALNPDPQDVERLRASCLSPQMLITTFCIFLPFLERTANGDVVFTLKMGCPIEKFLAV